MNLYKPDSTNLASLTRAQLVTKIFAGDRLTVMGVPPGSGQRMAFDRNFNGVLDGDEPLPELQLAQTGGNLVLSWPLSAVGYLEEAASLDVSTWSNNSDPVEIVNGLNFVTNSPGATAKFFRLRMP